MPKGHIEPRGLPGSPLSPNAKLSGLARREQAQFTRTRRGSRSIHGSSCTTRVKVLEEAHVVVNRRVKLHRAGGELRRRQPCRRRQWVDLRPLAVVVRLGDVGVAVADRGGLTAVCVGPFLKEFVKRKMVSLRALRSDSAGRSGRLFYRRSWRITVLSASGFVSVVVATGSCNRSFQYAIAPNTFLREVLLTTDASSSAW